MNNAARYYKGFISLAILAFLVGACSPDTPTVSPSPVETTPMASATVEGVTPIPTVTQTQPQPSATSVPLALEVNGMQITLAEYQAELGLYQDALSAELSGDDEARLIDDLIDQALLAQAATEEGFVVDETLIDDRLAQLITGLGSAQALTDWMADFGINEDVFRRLLARSVAAAWMRDQILAAVPETAEQVHARQILLYNSDEAAEVYVQLQSGNSFYNLAIEYNPITGGDLGWFPRGYLPDPGLEEAAFSLQPDEYSPVIETLAGFHIIQVIERDAGKLLAPEALLTVQAQSLRDWLEARRNAGEIQVYLP